MAAERAEYVARRLFLFPLLRMHELFVDIDIDIEYGMLGECSALGWRFPDELKLEFQWPKAPLEQEVGWRTATGWLEKEVFEDWIEHDLEEADRPLWQGQ